MEVNTLSNNGFVSSWTGNLVGETITKIILNNDNSFYILTNAFLRKFDLQTGQYTTNLSYAYMYQNFIVGTSRNIMVAQQASGQVLIQSLDQNLNLLNVSNPDASFLSGIKNITFDS